MTLQSKLLLALLPLAAALGLLGLAATRTVSRLGELSELILRDNHRSVLATQRMKDAAARLASAAAVRSLGRDDLAAAEQDDLLRFEAELRVQEGNITEEGEREATRQLRADWTAFRGEVDRHRAAPQPQRPEAYVARVAPAFARVEAAAERILAMNQQAIVRKSNDAKGAARRNVALMIALTSLAALVGVVASVLLTRRALLPLGRLSHAVRRLGQGDLDARAAVVGHDEIALLARDFDAMAQSLADYRRSSLGELLQAQQALQAAIDSLPDPVVVFDEAGRIANVNAAGESVLQLRAGAGADPAAAAEPALRALLERVRTHVVSGNRPYAPHGFAEAVRVEAAEGTRWLLPRAAPVQGHQGVGTGASIVLQDVTRLMRFDELKNDLVATVAHEFRTPLTSLRMAIHYCLQGTVGPVTAKQVDLLSTARADCERLQSMVDDLLDLSRIQAGKEQIEPVPMAARALVERAISQRRDDAAKAEVLLDGLVDGQAPRVLADPLRIALVLENLIGNALKHAPPGTPVEVRAEPDGAVVRFSVSDRGPGIPREHQQRIFEKFFRVPGEKAEGVGLGLYIAREIVRAHGGEMGIASAPGEGARFWFTLPIA